VLSRTSLSASTLDLDTEGGRPGDCSEVRVDVRWARASAIAHHNAMVTTKAVTTPHDDTAIRNKMMNSSNGCSLEPRRSNAPPNCRPVSLGPLEKLPDVSGDARFIFWILGA
jgi:hypothetical protein